MTALSAWQSFYEVIGSAAGTLIGLQFVVIGLIVNVRAPDAQVDAGAGTAFSTPTVIHFGTVLALAGIMCAPWEWIGPPAVLFGIAGGAGVIYAVVVVRRMRRQNAYRPEFEDWLFHAWLPLAAYVALVVSGLATRVDVRHALFGVAFAALLLLFVGIHNAWDAVTYHVFTKRR